MPDNNYEMKIVFSSDLIINNFRSNRVTLDDQGEAWDTNMPKLRYCDVKFFNADKNYKASLQIILNRRKFSQLNKSNLVKGTSKVARVG